METNEPNKKKVKPLWAIIAVAVCAFIAGGLVMWTVYNSNLQEELYSIVLSRSSQSTPPPVKSTNTTVKKK